MKFQTFSKIAIAFVAVALMAGCATKKPGWDYSAYKASKPRSILVLPPINNSPDITATYSVMSFVTKPLSEAGYYVMPVAMVAEAFKENGLTQPSDMHATSPDKLRQIFGADAALYITVTKFGVSYTVVNSETTVQVQGKLVDLKTGTTLWQGVAQASSVEGEQQQQGGLGALLVSAIIKQVLASTFDNSHKYSGIATERLLATGEKSSGLLFGPRSPSYGKD
ncbi:MAG: GNA1162 family protein [Betaproteobacteria bacterium]